MIDPRDPGAISPGAPADTRSIRDDVVDFARTLINLGANPTNAEARARYLELIAPGETAARAAELAECSGCELTGRGIWRRFILHPILEAPYRDRQAGADLLAIARAAGASTVGLARWPERGDVVIVGGGADGGGPEHAWTSLGVEGDSSEHARGIEKHEGLDGGQLDDDGKQLILVRRHQLRRGLDTTSSYARRVRCVLDVKKIIGAFGRRGALGQSSR